MGIPEVAIQLLQADVQRLPERGAANFVNALRRGHARPEHDPVHVDDPAS